MGPLGMNMMMGKVKAVITASPINTRKKPLAMSPELWTIRAVKLMLIALPPGGTYPLLR